ncbi:Acetyltransferase (GNAT) family protein [Methanococcoides vulcani]|uniref:Acetyltransferase (GNAT) family protein n=1 Tax=Methanococcoides vulcani TaxID=1353158 RepID=A0A1I0A0H7_9EURY|nr:GNAT family N-acetyltransferase [Methanococcoides vulcani]SES87167.1 Acetyltransferase (GNAT) family protein [Methanococcoides vulcani]
MPEPDFMIVDINESNLNEYDLFCKKSKKKEEGYQKKEKWFRERLNEGMHIKLLLVNEGKAGYRSRGFIEYIPGEYAWRGIDAKGYMVIHCIWVVGKNKNKGYGSKLLEECIKDSTGMKGVAVLTSKGNWLPASKLFTKHGFEKADELPPVIELYAKRFSDNVELPKINPVGKTTGEKGITILRSDQCPYVPDAVRIVENVAKKAGIPVTIKQLDTCDEVQNNGIHPFGTYCVLLDGEFLTYNCGVEKDIVKLLKGKGIDIS